MPNGPIEILVSGFTDPCLTLLIDKAVIWLENIEKAPMCGRLHNTFTCLQGDLVSTRQELRVGLTVGGDEVNTTTPGLEPAILCSQGALPFETRRIDRDF